MIPKHYDIKGLQDSSFKIIEKLMEHNNLAFRAFCYGNILKKYLFRFQQKGKRNDLLKARDYLEKMIKIDMGKDIENEQEPKTHSREKSQE